MPELDRQNIADIVSEVTRVMCDTVFVPGDPLDRGESLYRRLTMISMRGEPGITVVLAVDNEGGCALASSFFSCSPRDVTQPMIDDVVAELLNMLAGQISGALAYRYSLGLPRRTTVKELFGENLQFEQAILLRSKGRVDLGLWLPGGEEHGDGRDRTSLRPALKWASLGSSEAHNDFPKPRWVWES